MWKEIRAFLGLLFLLATVAAVAVAGEPNLVARQLNAFFEDPAFHRALWAVKIQSLETGEVLYEKNSDKLVLPASTMKLVTAFSALELLGPEFRLETQVATDGAVADDTLAGNLFVIGDGDPTLGARLSSPDPDRMEKGDPHAVFVEWADRLQALGIRKIEGDIIGDDSEFDRVPLGLGWAWDDLGYGYSAEVGGLAFNENVILLRVTPPAVPGSPVALKTFPETSYFHILSELKAVPAWEEADYRVQRDPDTSQAALVGTVVAGSAPFWASVAVENPTLYFLTVLKETLEREGIQVTGRIREMEDLNGEVRPGKTLIVQRSPDLSFLIRVLLKTSSNLYAESLIRMMDPHEKGKCFDEGREEVEGLLTGMGIPPDSYVLADGSGLSRYSLITVDSLVRILRHMYRSPYRKDFLAALPRSGVDGTLAGRMKQSPAEGKVFAKTGSLTNVRALAGYVTTGDGEDLAFAMVVNGYTQPRRSAEYIQDLALEYLAGMKGSTR